MTKDPIEYYSAEPGDAPPRRSRRIVTNIALGGVIGVVLMLVAMWVFALRDGDVRSMTLYFQTPEGLRGNHGPWRHSYGLRTLYDYAVAITLFGIIPLAALGAFIEGTVRALLVAGLAILLLAVQCGHFPLFD